MDFVLNSAFAEVPLDKVASTVWKLGVVFRTHKSEDIGVLEGRGKLAGAKHTLRSIEHFEKHHLMVGDNLGVELSLAKGRSHNFSVLVTCRRMLCLSIGSGCHFHHRWLPSEANPSHGASRRFEPGKTVVDLVPSEHSGHLLPASRAGDGPPLGGFGWR